MNEKWFKCRKIDTCCWEIEISDWETIDGITCDTMNSIADFLIHLGYEEITEEIDV